MNGWMLIAIIVAWLVLMTFFLALARASGLADKEERMFFARHDFFHHMRQERKD